MTTVVDSTVGGAVYHRGLFCVDCGLDFLGWLGVYSEKNG